MTVTFGGDMNFVLFFLFFTSRFLLGWLSVRARMKRMKAYMTTLEKCQNERTVFYGSEKESIPPLFFFLLLLLFPVYPSASIHLHIQISREPFPKPVLSLTPSKEKNGKEKRERGGEERKEKENKCNTLICGA